MDKDKIKQIVKEELELVMEKRKERRHAKEHLRDVTFRVFYDPQEHTNDVLTDMRIIKGVATVYQASPSMISKLGREVIDVKINYVPLGMSHPDYIDFLAKSTRTIKGVQLVKIIKIAKKRLTTAIGPIKQVY